MLEGGRLANGRGSGLYKSLQLLIRLSEILKDNGL